MRRPANGKGEAQIEAENRGREADIEADIEAEFEAVDPEVAMARI